MSVIDYEVGRQPGFGDRPADGRRIARRALIVDALDGAFYLAFGNVVPSGKRLVLALDVSGSMTMGAVAGVPGLTPRIASAAMAPAAPEVIIPDSAPVSSASLRPTPRCSSTMLTKYCAASA